MRALIVLWILCGCESPNVLGLSPQVFHSSVDTIKKQPQSLEFKKSSWPYFLQHLLFVEGPIVDYRGNLVENQEKHVAVLNYDVGTADLQQCADALMRLRAEYLFGQNRFKEIGFHFTNGWFYSWMEYCNGWRPVVKTGKLRLIKTAPSSKNHQSLRSYLDIVYSYAGTISLCKELKLVNRFEVGTVVIKPGSPGHCLIIVDEAISKRGARFFKLAEGYTPAQSIYLLRNTYDDALSPWYELKGDTILTASYAFTTYSLRKFE